MRQPSLHAFPAVVVAALVPLVFPSSLPAADKTAGEPGDAPLVRSAGSGPWSAATTWEGGKVPATGARMLIRPGDSVVYDVKSEQVIRSIHVGGTLTFARDRDTRLDVGLLKIQAGEDVRETGFDCEAHLAEPEPGAPRATLEVGTPEQPIPPEFTALIRLVYVPGMDKESCPAIVCCGGRMEFHGAPLSHTWVKLGATARAGDDRVTLAEPVTGCGAGDRVIFTATRLVGEGHGGKDSGTEERTIRSVDGATLTLDKPLDAEHQGTGAYRGEAANLSRNVVVESADPAGVRGHTMYHRNSAGSIGYAEFRHLGKAGVLGRYSLHYHLVGETMRGSSVIGASIWDSANRWLTIHGTNYLVVRDCVGYQSIGHGFYLEDGTEVYNVLDHNLAVQARRGKPLPKQVLPFDQNEGAGFWWANSLNTFTNNVACENARYGYRFEATRGSRFNPTLSVQQPDGTHAPTDIRTLPFVRFDDNEAHCNGLYGFNLGEGVDRVGPDARHPFVVRNAKLWQEHYAFRPQSPSVLVENMVIHQCAYGVYHPNYDRHVYRNMLISETNEEPFNRGHDDLSVQYGVLAVDGLTFAGNRDGYIPLIQISDDNPTGAAESHFRNVKVVDRRNNNRRALVNLGGGPRPTPKTPKGVPIYLHDYYGPGRDAKVASTRARDLINDGNEYRKEPPLTGDESRVAEVHDIPFPELLTPVHDLPPATVITGASNPEAGKLVVRGTASDNGTIARVLVNGREARPLQPNFAEWEVVLEDVHPGGCELSADAEDTAGNVERVPHVMRVKVAPTGTGRRGETAMSTPVRASSLLSVSVASLLLGNIAPTPASEEQPDAAAVAAQLRELDARVMPADAERAKQLRRMVGRDADNRIQAANERESKAWQAIETRAEWERFRDSRIEALRESLGTFPPPPQDLKVRVTRSLAGDGYRIEDVIFESRPGLVATANIYVPARSPASMPGIIICHSHHNPKSEGELQDMGMTWARLGCTVLVLDQLGHGERRQHPFSDASAYPRPFRVGRQDYYFRYNEGIQLHVIGDSLIGWMVWDLMRGVDLLLRTPGLDRNRIILLGAVAGGGDPAAVAAALDPRIAAVVPFNFGGPQPETAYPLPADAADTFNYAGGGSWESTRNLRLSARDGFLPWVIVGGVAPRRLVYGHEFSWDRPHDPVWARLERIFALYDARDRLAAAHGRGKVTGQPPENTHCNNIGPEQRKLIYPALGQWFRIPQPASEFRDRRPANELMCLTPEARAEIKPRPLFELAGDLGAERAEAARKRLAGLNPAERRQRLRQDWTRLLGDVEPPPASKVLSRQVQSTAAATVERVVLEVEPGIVVPLILLLPSPRAGAAMPIVVAFAQEGKQAFLKNRSQALADLLAGGSAVCLPDLRGTGETRPGDSRDRNSAATAISATELMLGRTLVGLRLRDLRSVLKYLRSRAELNPARIALWGDSFAMVNSEETRVEVPLDADPQPNLAEPLGGLLALFGALFEEDIHAVCARGGLSGYQAVLKSPFCCVPHDAIVPGALTVGDLSDVAAALAPRPLRLDGLVDGLNRRVPAQELARIFEPALSAYRDAGVGARLRIDPGGDAPGKWLLTMIGTSGATNCSSLLPERVRGMP